MRCLYCNKELALLKRLTGGAEFCSDAHRKKYQEEFNDLALNRLLQTPAALPAKPLTEREPKIEPVPEPTPVPSPPPRARSTASGSPKLVPAVAPPPAPPPVQAKATPKPPQPADPAIAGYLIEEPVSSGLAFVVAAGEPPFLAPTQPELPLHALQAVASEHGFSQANPVAMNLAMERRAAPIRPRDGNLEIREFSRQAVAPVQPLQQDIVTNDSALSSAFGEAMEIINQPRPPAEPPMIWQAGPQPAPTVDIVLGDLSRLDFAVTDFGEDLPPEQPPRPSPHFTTAPAMPTVDPVAAAPASPAPTVENLPAEVRQPVVAAQPPAAPIPEPVTASLPVTLHGVGAGAAKPASIISAGLTASIEPQVPASSALPLRPTMILASRPQPAPVAAAPIAVPVAAPAPIATAPVSPAPAPPAPVANTSVVRPVRGTNGKTRRPEVRVVQTGASGTTPAPHQTAPVPAPPAPATVARTIVTPVKNNVARPIAPETSKEAAPKDAAKSELPKVALRPEPVKAPKPEIDLNLPVLHNPEVSGPWAKLPAAAKAGIGAVLALGIVGLAYTVFNGSNAAATTTAAKTVAPSYQLGKQINSNGWIEDWAPAASTRHITLLRGSQPYSDYRIEFQAQIQRKAIGWMYRGLNPRNYYVVKLEKLKSGIEPEVALVRYAVIDGESEKRVEKVLPMKVRVDTTYKIRFDAVGSEFAVWVQDKKIDEWRDSRLGSGGVGLYSEGDEAAAVNGTVNVYELVSTK
jgi:hypothetical protein